MRNLMIGVALTIGMAAPAIAGAQYGIKVHATERQVTQWQDGTQYVDDVQPNSTARVLGAVAELPGDPSTFQVFVLNNSDTPINFGPEDVSIQMPDGEVIQMTTFDELAGKLRRDVKRRKVFGAIGNAFAARDADGQTSGTFSYSGTNSYGTRYSGSGWYSGYDPALQAQQQRAAREQAEATNNAINAREYAGNRELSQLLRRTTVQPGEVVGGLLAYDAPKGFKKLENGEYPVVLIRAGSEVHRLYISVSKVD